MRMISVRRQACLALQICLMLTASYADADRYIVPPEDLDLIGRMRTTRTYESESLIALTRRLGLGQQEIRHANPGVDRWVPGEGESIILPTRYILPDTPRSGVVVNLPEMRLYYFHTASNEPLRFVDTFPVSIGRELWETPLGLTHVIGKKSNPDWYPPQSIKQEALERGVQLADRVPAGPDNPLGDHAIYLDVPGYLMHGTNAPNGIGMQVTHGCIRLYPDDINYLFDTLEIGTQINLINQPVKVGWHADVLYLEVHPPVLSPKPSIDQLMESAVALIKKQITDPDYHWRTSQIRRIVSMQTGVPAPIHRLSAGTDNRRQQP